MQCFQEEKHRDQRKKSEDRQIGALTEDPVEQLHQPDKENTEYVEYGEVPKWS